MKKNVLILCTGNSCRSQMAHGFLSKIAADIEVFSAGTEPAEKINPVAVKVMAEVGIDISQHTPHAVSEYINRTWDYVITVCDNVNENCPVFTGNVGKRIHIGFDDPSKTVGSDDFIFGEFVRVRDQIKTEMSKFYIVEVKGLRLPHCTCNDK